MKKVFSLFVFLFLSALSANADSPRDYAAWWIKSYGVVDSQIDPLVGRAEKIFDRVCAASDKKGTRFPRLLIIKASGDPYAQVISDGTVVLTHGGLKICYRDVTLEKGDSRLAFILGHELAHLAKDDFWHSLSFLALKEYGEEGKAKESLKAQLKWDMGDPKTQEFVRKQELQADSYGLIYMTMAGYDPKSIIDKDGTNFFEDWVSQITGKIAYSDATHPGPAERAEFLRTQLAPVSDVLDYFTFGVRLYQLGRYADAILLLEAFKEKFPSREVFNNIGLCHYQLAMKVLSGCDESLPLRFKLSTILDMETLGTRLRTPGTESSLCFKNPTFQKHIQEAIRYLNNAAEMDPTYVPSRINLSSALIMAGHYSKAMGTVDEALKIQPENPEALNNKSIALYLFGKTSNIDTADHAIAALKNITDKNASFSDAFYNMAAIQSERGRSATAAQTFKAFLEIEPGGVYAQAARERLGIKGGGNPPAPRRAEMNSPIKLGQIRSETEKQLKGLKRREFNIGAFSGDIYEGGGIKVLVIDYTVEVVEKEIETPIGGVEFLKGHGSPIREMKTLQGSTFVYSNLLADVIDGKVKRIVYFKKETI